MKLLSLFLLELPVFLLFAGKGKTDFIISSCVFAVLLIVLWATREKMNIRPKLWIDHPFLTGLLSMAFGAFFVLRWGTSHRLEPIGQYLDLSIKQTSILTALSLCLIALPGIDFLINSVFALLSVPASSEKNQHTPLFITFFIAITAFLVILLNSRSSVLYPINDWVDPNTMFTVGKGVLKGYVPYADLYEQKGPLLIFIHTLGAFVSYDSFAGIWLIEFLFCFASLFLIYKIYTLFFWDDSFLLIPLTAVLLYGTGLFSPGDTAEEYCLPLISYAVYAGLKAVRNGSFPEKRVFFWIGITSGCVFWIKYSDAGFYPGWFLYFLIYAMRRKRLFPLFKGIGLILTGVLCASLPVLGYFMLHSAQDKLFEAYFYNNIFLYADRQTTLTMKILNGFIYYLQCAPWQAIFTFIGMVWLVIRRKWNHFLFVFVTFLTSVIFIYMGGMYHGYSGIPLSLFVIFGILCLWDIFYHTGSVKSAIDKHRQPLSVPILLAGLILVSAFSNNMRYLDHTQEDWYQFQMKEVIEQSGIDRPNILYYNMGDSGINTVAESLPDLRFFCYYHNPNLTDMVTEQRECIENQCADFIVAFAKNEKFYPLFETYEHAGYFMGVRQEGYPCYHYYVPRRSVPAVSR